MKEYYDILGIPPGSSEEEVKKAYRKLAQEKHPDHGGNEEEFKKINEAYSILSGKQTNKNVPPTGSPFDFDFSSMFDHLNRQYAHGFGAQRARRPAENDRDIPLSVEITIEDIRNGKDFTIEYQKSKKCEKCGGIGGDQKIKCNDCMGHGMRQDVHVSDNSRFVTQYPCPTCGGIGEIVLNSCNVCQARGFVVYSSKLNFEIKEKK
jgi:molecular chaperone DnaJ